MRPHEILSALLLSLFMFFFQSSLVLAQVARCNGIWTNKPCNERVKQIPEKSNQVHLLSESIRTNTSPQGDPFGGKVLREKKSLLHDLTMKKIEAEHNYDLKLNITDVEEFCKRESTNVSDCRKTVDDMEEKIDRRVYEAGSIKAQNQANELQAERNKIEAAKESPKAVTIVKQTVFIRRKHRPSLEPSAPHSTSVGEASAPGLDPNTPNAVGQAGSIPSMPNPSPRPSVRKSGEDF